MKKIILSIFLLFLIACNKDNYYQKNIIGSYYFSQTEEVERNTWITIEATETYNINRKCYQQGVLTLSFLNEYNERNSVKFNCSLIAKYEIKNETIIYDYDIDKFEITPMSESGSVGRKIKTIMDDYLIPQMKQGLINDKGSKIIELNDKNMILDNDGKQTTYKRQD